MTRRLLTVSSLALALLTLGPAAAFACGGLVAPGHAEVLQKATTLAAWHAGYEHYVTGFRFAGTAESFGYIVPLPGAPVSIVKGGNWTLERLEREVNPPAPAPLEKAVFAAAAARVQVLQQVQIEALDVTVVRGGGADVARWAQRNGFDLTSDAPRVLGRYASSGAVFALAKFDRATAARTGLIQGQGQTIQFVVKTPGPWIPLRILALGKGATELVDADLFVLTDGPPAVAPVDARMPGMTTRASGWASPTLLHDLRIDQGMGWVPRAAWFTALTLHATAGSIGSDLAFDGERATALARNQVVDVPNSDPWATPLVAAVAVIGLFAGWLLWRRPGSGVLDRAGVA
jgi:Uncharacterized protein conserved in bacteria (DUF2330)